LKWSEGEKLEAVLLFEDILRSGSGSGSGRLATGGIEKKREGKIGSELCMAEFG